MYGDSSAVGQCMWLLLGCCYAVALASPGSVGNETGVGKNETARTMEIEVDNQTAITVSIVFAVFAAVGISVFGKSTCPHADTFF